MEPLIILGAGGFGREVFSLLRDINRVAPTWEVRGFGDDDPDALSGFSDYGVVRWSLDQLPVTECRNYVCAMGDPSVRRSVVERLSKLSLNWPCLIHPSVGVGCGSVFGSGCILCRQTTLTTNVTLGDHVHLNVNASVGHDARIASFCSLAGHVDVCGHAVLDEGVFLGSHASVLPQARVGAWARVGAGSVVLRAVQAGDTVFGVPARRVR